MTPRDRFIAALECRPAEGLVPHFELVFFLTMEAFGRIHPSQRHYRQWRQMSDRERDLHRRDIADLYVQTAQRFGHSAIFFHQPGGWEDDYDGETRATLEIIRQISGDEYLLMIHGDTTLGIPDGDGMVRLSEAIADEPQKVKDNQARRVERALQNAEAYRKHGALDCFALCSDYCFNTGPFLSPAMFDEFVTPYLARLTAGYRELGFYVIKHTDGNIMPILESLLSTKPHALHSLDPQGSVDIAQVRRRVGNSLCLCGNVNCALMDTGTDAQVLESAQYALRHGLAGDGYIFSTSNCIYTGMCLDRYELILDVWRREGARQKENGKRKK